MNAIAKISYTHDALIDQIIANPTASQGQLAGYFGYTPAWLSRIMSSDAFKARLANRRAQIVDPALVADVEERLEAVARRSLDVLLEKLDASPTADTVLKAVDISTRALGYGAKSNGVTVNQQFVVHTPPKAEDAASWARQYAPRSPTEAVEDTGAVITGSPLTADSHTADPSADVGGRPVGNPAGK